MKGNEIHDNTCKEMNLQNIQSKSHFIDLSDLSMGILFFST